MIGLVEALMILTFIGPGDREVTMRIDGLNFGECVKAATFAIHYPKATNLKDVSCVAANGDSVYYKVPDHR